jgi:ABC-type sugar transport system substrate-binding protein
MNKKLTAGLATGAVALAVAAGGAAYAAASSSAGGPPVVSPPGSVGPYFSQGAAVNQCIADGSGAPGWTELHSDTLGNCPRGYTQLTVSADPSAIPTPSP